MTTDQAFWEMINTRGIYHRLGLSAYTVRRMRLDLKNGVLNTSLERKMELLLMAGYHLVQEPKWQAPRLRF
jgi:hypothetical protein